MVELAPIGDRRVIANLPEAEVDELLPACEILCQEGFTTWSVPIERVAEIPALTAAFRRRARVGVSGVTDVAQVRKAAAAGAAFAASSYLLPKLVKAVADFPVILGGLTPSELRAGLDAGAAAIQVLPANAFGTDYVQSLPELLGYPPLIATGDLRRGWASTWLDSGAIAVWPQRLFEETWLAQDDLAELRSEVRTWRLD